jgi:hypothetical protein
MKRQTLSKIPLINQVVVQTAVSAASVVMFQYLGKPDKYPDLSSPTFIPL